MLAGDQTAGLQKVRLALINPTRNTHSLQVQDGGGEGEWGRWGKYILCCG